MDLVIVNNSYFNDIK